MGTPLAGTVDRLHLLSPRRVRVGSSWVAMALVAVLAMPSSVRAAAPTGTGTSAPPVDPAAAEPSAPVEPPSDPPPSDAVPGDPTPSDPPPSDAPPGEPKSAGPTPPSETTNAPPTTADTKSVGSRSPRPKPAKDDVTVLEGSPDRMRPMQKAGWWTLFGGFVFATVGGVFSGLAERQEDKAERIAVRFDENSAQPNYADVKDDYEQILARGNAFASTAIALGVVGGSLAIAGITLLAVDEARLRKRDGKRRARLELRKGGLQVKF